MMNAPILGKTCYTFVRRLCTEVARACTHTVNNAATVCRLVNEERTLEVEIEQGVRDEMEYPFIGEGAV